MEFYSKYNEYDDEDESNKADEKQIAKWKEQAKQLKSSKDHIYILTLVSWDHGANWGSGPDETTIGVFNSKDAAVAKSVHVNTNYGTFDEAIKDTFDNNYIDNRMNPPDNGILIQIGSDDTGEGDNCRLVIEKHAIEGLEGLKVQNKNKRASKTTKSSKTEVKGQQKKRVKSNICL